MPKELATSSYFQVPKILLEQTKITGDHIFIFMILYEQLRQSPCDKKGFNKTNDYLCEITNIGLTQLKYKLSDLETWGFICREGMGSKRQFFLGTVFTNQPEFDPVSKQTRPEYNPIPAGNRPSTSRKSNYIANNYSKNNTNKAIYSFEQKQKYQEYVGMFKTKQRLGMEDKDASPLAIEEWYVLNYRDDE